MARRTIAALMVAAMGFIGALASGVVLPSAQASAAHAGATATVGNQNPRVSISGRREVGQRLTANLTGVPNNATVRLQWFRNTTSLQGATSNARRLTNQDAGQEVAVRATIRRPGQADVVLWQSAFVAPIAEPELLTEAARLIAADSKFEPATNTRRQQGIEGLLHNRINAVRRSHGLQPLVRDAVLDSLARGHSQDLATSEGWRAYCAQCGILSHTGSDGRGPNQRMRDAGFSQALTGENLFAGCGQSTAEDAVEAWLNSPGHRRAILTPEFTTTGIGVEWADSGLVYFTQKFIAPSASIAQHIRPGLNAAATDSEIERAIFAATNAARKAQGLAPLSRLAELDAIAMAGARNRANNRPTLGSIADRLNDAEIFWTAAGENELTSRAASGQAFVDSWLMGANSILQPDYTTVGIGIARNADGQVFANLILISQESNPDWW